MDSEAISITSSNTVLGYHGPDNMMIIRFTPKTTLSRSGSGEIRILMPKWFDKRFNSNTMF